AHVKPARTRIQEYFEKLSEKQLSEIKKCRLMIKRATRAARIARGELSAAAKRQKKRKSPSPGSSNKRTPKSKNLVVDTDDSDSDSDAGEVRRTGYQTAGEETTASGGKSPEKKRQKKRSWPSPEPSMKKTTKGMKRKFDANNPASKKEGEVRRVGNETEGEQSEQTSVQKSTKRPSSTQTPKRKKHKTDSDCTKSEREDNVAQQTGEDTEEVTTPAQRQTPVGGELSSVRSRQKKRQWPSPGPSSKRTLQFIKFNFEKEAKEPEIKDDEDQCNGNESTVEEKELDTSVNTPIVFKKKPGRPKKVVVADESSDSEQEESGARRTSDAVVEEGESSVDASSVVKKRRGRPKKITVKEEEGGEGDTEEDKDEMDHERRRKKTSMREEEDTFTPVDGSLAKGKKGMATLDEQKIATPKRKCTKRVKTSEDEKQNEEERMLMED
ncbi:hypothetical protein PFISCL1PPCAC_26632, partial [Pristionchus fissidentatus]